MKSNPGFKNSLEYIEKIREWQKIVVQQMETSWSWPAQEDPIKEGDYDGPN
jgi:hypothetical protein